MTGEVVPTWRTYSDRIIIIWTSSIIFAAVSVARNQRRLPLGHKLTLEPICNAFPLMRDRKPLLLPHDNQCEAPDFRSGCSGCFSAIGNRLCAHVIRRAASAIRARSALFL